MPDGLVGIVTVKNSSLSGAFVETDARISPLARVAMRPVAKDSEWLGANVVRVEDTGIAIEWLEPGLHSLYVLLSVRPTNR
jgi:hypothetical protein